MTKPKSSEKTSSDSEKNNKQITPTSAKELFSDFVPEASDSDEGEKCNPEPASKKQKRYTQKYKKEWEQQPEFKSWLSESIHGNTYFYCKYCKKDYRCGKSDIHKHMSSKKHCLKAAAPEFKALKFKFRGLLCPVFTPFSNTKRVTPDVNLKAVAKYANFLKACDIKGILINDILGEGMSLTIRERMDLTDAWSEACGKNNQFLMVQIGGAPLKDIIEMAKHAAKKEVGAIVLLPDLYNRPKTHLDLIKYIKLISEFTKDTPILYHHHPEFSKIEINITSFLLDITGEVESFVGVIFSTNNIQQSTAAMNVNREKFTIFMATDESILGASAHGFTCIMSTSLNFLPKLVQSICDAVRDGDLKKAQKSQCILNRTINIVLEEGDYVAAFKAATEIISSTCGVITREPLQTLWEGTIQKLQGKIRDLGLT